MVVLYFSRTKSNAEDPRPSLLEESLKENCLDTRDLRTELQYEGFIMIKKLIDIVIILKLSDQGTLQVCLVSITSFSFSVLIVYLKPFNYHQELFDEVTILIIFNCLRVISGGHYKD